MNSETYTELYQKEPLCDPEDYYAAAARPYTLRCPSKEASIDNPKPPAVGVCFKPLRVNPGSSDDDEPLCDPEDHYAAAARPYTLHLPSGEALIDHPKTPAVGVCLKPLVCMMDWESTKEPLCDPEYAHTSSARPYKPLGVDLGSSDDDEPLYDPSEPDCDLEEREPSGLAMGWYVPVNGKLVYSLSLPVEELPKTTWTSTRTMVYDSDDDVLLD